MTPAFTVEARAGAYPVFCGDDVAAGLAAAWDPRWRNAAVIGDSHTHPRFAPALEAALRPQVDRVVSLSFPAGEAHKTRATKEALEDALLAEALGRDTCVVAVGGGIALDVAGFVAATYLRGVPHVNVATSLLAQVDAAIGGKTGVNTAAGKNLVGAFHAPAAVFLDTAALTSLPVEERDNGLAEAVKHAVVADAGLFEALERFADTEERWPADELIARLAAVKAEVVDDDERELGRRAVLNFGHSAAHAIEGATDHAVPHGRAVAIGMRIEARLARRLGRLGDADGARLNALLDRLGLPRHAPCSFAEAAAFLRRDKKNRADTVHVALPSAIGSFAPTDGAWTRAVETATFAEAWEEER